MLLLLACHAEDVAPTPAAEAPVTWGDPVAHGDGAMTVTLAADGDLLVPTVTAGDAGATFEGLVLAGTWSLDGEAVLWRQGYQSWSWSGVLELEEPELVDGVPVAEGDGDTWTVATETPATSWWAGLVGVHGGESVLVGTTSATRTKFYTAFGPGEVYAVWGMRGERVAMGPNETLTLDPLLVLSGTDPDALWADWAGRVPGRAPSGSPPVGWSDWYQYYGDVTFAELRAELAAAPDGVEVFQVDDGWEVAWGDWTGREDTAALAADIEARGMRPGLWMAPLYVDVTTQTYADHPDWWVRDAQGEVVVHGSLLGMDLAVLDVTHPDAAAWLSGELAAKVAEGWTYLKLDFLYAGAIEGDRYEDVTGTEAYARAMAVAREAMGEESWFLACGAPMLPSVGWADSWRSGADIAYEVSPEPQPAFLRWQARNSAARAFANGVWWWSDADALLVRGWDEVGTRGAVAANVASGGAWFLGDGFAELDAGQLALLLDAELVGAGGRTPAPEDPLAWVSGFDAGPLGELGDPDDAVPVRWRLGEDVVVLLNLSEDEVEVESPGGTELTGRAGDRTFAAGDGEVWALP